MVEVHAIRTEADYDAALLEIEQYFLSPPAPGSERRSASMFSLI